MDTDQVIAPFFLGIICSYFLWGIQISQSYHYYKSYRKTDRIWLKGGVLLLFIVDAIHTVCASQVAWRFLVEGWGDIDGISSSPGWGLNTISITDSIIASVVHAFYAHKIWSLYRSPYDVVWTGMTLTLSLIQLIGGIGCGVFMFVIKITFAEFGRIKTWACLWLIGASVTDVLITVLLSWRLRQSRTGFKATDDIISQLIRTTVETGLATAVVQFADILIYLIWTTKTYHMVLGLMGPKVYSNSMLALLNSRRPRGETSFHSSADGVQIRTTQTITTIDQVELRSRKYPRTDDSRSANPDAESIDIVPYKHDTNV